MSESNPATPPQQPSAPDTAPVCPDDTGQHEQAQPQQGRDKNGRFAKGNPGGPGNPFSRQLAHMRQVLLECVSEEDLRDIVAQVVQKAKQGDLAAARLVLSYAVGKPQPAAEPDRLDVQEIDLYQQQAVGLEHLLIPVKALSAALVCDMLRAILPKVEEQHRRLGEDMFLASLQPGYYDDDEEDEEEDDEEEDEQGQAPAAAAEAAQGGKRRRVRRPEPGQGLPSVQQLLAEYRALQALGRSSADPSAAVQAPGQPGADSQRAETERRAANPGP
jgi:hypothetical protein